MKLILVESQKLHQIFFWSFSNKDGGSPDARLRFARLMLARLRLNDGAKLWISFKLCFKTFFFITNIQDLHYKGLDIPSFIPLIAKFCLCSIRKKLSPKNGVASKFIAKVLLV